MGPGRTKWDPEVLKSDNGEGRGEKGKDRAVGRKQMTLGRAKAIGIILSLPVMEVQPHKVPLFAGSTAHK